MIHDRNLAWTIQTAQAYIKAAATTLNEMLCSPLASHLTIKNRALLLLTRKKLLHQKAILHRLQPDMIISLHPTPIDLAPTKAPSPHNGQPDRSE